MKKILLILGLVVSPIGAVNQPHNIGNVKTDGLGLPSYTVAQMNALTSDTTGQVILVSDATQSRLCISSGTVNPGAWVVASATGVFAGASYPHCR